MREIIKTGLIILLSLSTFCYAWNYYNDKPKYIQLSAIPVIDTFLSPASPVIVYKDAMGNQHDVKDNSTIHTIIEGEKQEQAAQMQPIINKLAESLSVAKDNTPVYTSSVSQKELILQNQVDSLKKISLFYKDRFLTLQVAPAIPPDSISTFDFAYNADLNVQQYDKRKWFLGEKESFIYVTSMDPRITINNKDTFIIKQNTPVFGLRVQAVGGYNFNSNTYFAGPSLAFDVKNTTFKASYIYTPYNKKWAPSFRVEYNLIKF